MKKIMKTILNIIRHIIFAGYYLIAHVRTVLMYNRAYKKGEISYLSRADFRVWKKSMLAMLREFCAAGYNFRIHQVIDTFAKAPIEVIRKRSPEEMSGGQAPAPIVVLCIKNDLKRIKVLMDHYRALGVKHFAFLDNGSDDGTFEWLTEQPDIDLFRTYQPYKTAVKEGWISRIVSYYGFDRWYILTDSDELLVYNGMEEHPLNDVIRWAGMHGVDRFKALTLDMYADGELFGKTEDIRGDYKWMDVDSYYWEETAAGLHTMKMYHGGPRHRLMGSVITLSKHPLIYYSKGTISASAHYQYPFDKLESYETTMGILHFKFIDSDLEEYKRRINPKSGFSTGGINYKKYIEAVERSESLTFMYDGSVEFNGSESLRKVEAITPLEIDLSEEEAQRALPAKEMSSWKKAQFGIKRAFDITVAGLMILLLTVFPVLIIIPILIRLESKGAPVFTQERMGKDQKRFKIFKFRTMRQPPEGTYSVDGILYKANGELLEPSSTRITKLGAFLRKTSLDELMQLFNILNGTMSFVGPRPTLPYQAESYSAEQLRRFEVRPGVTGLAQVSGRNDLTWTEKISYDIEYVDHFSLWMDFKILLKTVAVVLKKDQIEFTKEDDLTVKAQHDTSHDA